ncbi:MAG TPA: BREX system ATP-binding protein BrxD, partial [Opitutus sp.]|nr:BREX system ATP-binding protein BrxD [Opitutus sp.]
MAAPISPRRREQVLDALRRGTVPQEGLAALAVGLERFQSTVSEDLDRVAAGSGAFKAIRGDYGCGKTFFSRWIQEQARQRKFATAEVQISDSETPLHKLETVYRRLAERIATAATSSGAFRSIIDSWFYALEEDVLSSGKVGPDDAAGLIAATNTLMEQRLDAISRKAPAFSAALRGYRNAQARGDTSTAEGLIAWVAGQPNVSAAIKRTADIKGEVDHDASLSFLQGLLVVLRDSGHAGLFVVLDEVETLQRVRADVREKALNALRQLIDSLDAGWFPGLLIVITGTPAF